MNRMALKGCAEKSLKRAISSISKSFHKVLVSALRLSAVLLAGGHLWAATTAAPALDTVQVEATFCSPPASLATKSDGCGKSARRTLVFSMACATKREGGGGGGGGGGALGRHNGGHPAIALLKLVM